MKPGRRIPLMSRPHLRPSGTSPCSPRISRSSKHSSNWTRRCLQSTVLWLAFSPWILQYMSGSRLRSLPPPPLTAARAPPSPRPMPAEKPITAAHAGGEQRIPRCLYSVSISPGLSTFVCRLSHSILKTPFRKIRKKNEIITHMLERGVKSSCNVFASMIITSSAKTM